MSRVVYEPATAPPSPGESRRWWAKLLLDLSHRSGAVALFAGVAVWVLIGKGSPVRVPLAVAAGAADVGMCAAWAARLLAADPVAARRTNGVLLFCVAAFALALQTMLLDHLGVIGTDGADVVALCVGAAVAVVVLGVIARGPPGGTPARVAAARRRTGGLLVICLAVFLVALYTLLLDRLGTIGADVADFFTPAPVSAEHR